MVVGIGCNVECSVVKFEVGDSIVFNKKFGKEFDLLKDSMVVKCYDCVGKKVKK